MEGCSNYLAGVGLLRASPSKDEYLPLVTERIWCKKQKAVRGHLPKIVVFSFWKDPILFLKDRTFRRNMPLNKASKKVRWMAKLLHHEYRDQAPPHCPWARGGAAEGMLDRPWTVRASATWHRAAAGGGARGGGGEVGCS